MELTRRWVAALVMVAPEDREALVASVERRVVEAYEGSDERNGIVPPTNNAVLQLERVVAGFEESSGAPEGAGAATVKKARKKPAAPSAKKSKKKPGSAAKARGTKGATR